MATRQPNSKTPATPTLIDNSQVALALKVVGDRWIWLIMRDLFLGHRRFEALRRRTGAARGTLTARLNALVENGILYKNPYQTSPTRYEYRLTDKGLGFYPQALLVWAWETKWTAQHDELPAALWHRPCGHATVPELRCTACREIIVAKDVTWSPGPGAARASGQPPATQRRQRSRNRQADGVDTTFFHAVDFIGDRWTMLVMAAAWFGLHRYDDIGAAIGIATNILADRLKRLTAAGVLERRPYRENPKRYEYRLTEKGRDLYGFTLMLHQWADDWLVGSEGPGLKLKHTCGKPLVGAVVCSECGEQLKPGDVSYGED